jgi:RimJ/RimL family protein N-acetyltransferase
MLAVQPVTLDKLHLLEVFVQTAGDSLTSFRYFNSRPLTIIKEHKATFLITINNVPVAYGHLDFENEIVWLGIAVANKYKGNGLGQLMMNVLITEARIQKIPAIRLSVDNNNEAAIGLYLKMGFEVKKVKENIQFLEKKL